MHVIAKPRRAKEARKAQKVGYYFVAEVQYLP